MKALITVGIFSVIGFVFGAESCCTPPRWEGTMSEWGGAAREFGHPTLISEMVYYAYDEINERVAAVVEVEDKFVRAVGDYQEKRLYVVYGSHCKYYRLDRQFQRACTGNSTFLGSFSFGAGIESLKLNAWKAEVDGMGVIFSTTPRNCIPVSEAVAGKFRKEYFALSIGFTDVSLGIKDPRIFEHPSTCEPAGWGDAEEQFEELHLSSAVTYMLKKTIQ